MGFTNYSAQLRSDRAKELGYYENTTEQNFTQRSTHREMDPKGIKVRESRDSEAHPESVPIILGLDVTGSMGTVPQHMVQHGLPTIMETIIQRGTPDPQILFLGIGDHECDESPLQVGQFESGDEELDHWLTSVYLEGGGGGNAGESYLLAWYFAAFHTETDAWEKRNRKGFLFTVGDEPCLLNLPAASLTKIMGPHQHGDLSAAELLKEAQERYQVYHINIAETHAGKRTLEQGTWKQMLGDNFINLEDHSAVSKTIAEVILNYQKPASAEAKEDSEIIL